MKLISKIISMENNTNTVKTSQNKSPNASTIIIVLLILTLIGLISWLVLSGSGNRDSFSTSSASATVSAPVISLTPAAQQTSNLAQTYSSTKCQENPVTRTKFACTVEFKSDLSAENAKGVAISLLQIDPAVTDKATAKITAKKFDLPCSITPDNPRILTCETPILDLPAGKYPVALKLIEQTSYDVVPEVEVKPA